MEAGLIVLAIVMVIVVCVAAFVCLKNKKPSTKQQEIKGVLNIVCGNPGNTPELFLGLGVPVEDIVSQKQVLFTVNVIRENSHK